MFTRVSISVTDGTWLWEKLDIMLYVDRIAKDAHVKHLKEKLGCLASIR